MIGTYIDLGSMTSLMSAGSTTVSTSSTTDHNITPDELTTTLSLSTTTAASSPSSPYNTIVMDTTQSIFLSSTSLNKKMLNGNK